jgi:hypothetical protein
MAPDREIGKPLENRGKVIAHRDLQPTAAFPDRENRRNLRSCLWAANGQPILFFRPRATRRIELSAKFVRSSNSGYSKKQGSCWHSASAFLAGLAECARRQCTALPRSCSEHHRDEHHREEAWLFPDAEHGGTVVSTLRQTSASTADGSSMCATIGDATGDSGTG